MKVGIYGQYYKGEAISYIEILLKTLAGKNIEVFIDKGNVYFDIIDVNLAASFEYQLYDGQLTSDYATATITLAPRIIAEELFKDWPTLSTQSEGTVLELMNVTMSVQELITSSLHGDIGSAKNQSVTNTSNNNNTPFFSTERSRDAAFISNPETVELWILTTYAV